MVEATGVVGVFLASAVLLVKGGGSVFTPFTLPAPHCSEMLDLLSQAINWTGQLVECEEEVSRYVFQK